VKHLLLSVNGKGFEQLKSFDQENPNAALGFASQTIMLASFTTLYNPFGFLSST